MMTVTRRTLLPALLAAIALVCGCAAEQPARDVASIDTPTASAQAQDFEQAVQRYQQCLRDNGFTGGGTVDGGDDPGPVTTVEPDPDAAPDQAGDLAAAQEKCRELQPDGGALTTQDPEQADLMRAWAQCLRDKGLPVTESGDGTPQVGVRDGDTEMRAKVEECDRQVYGGTAHDGGSVGSTR